jgi:hypothetical protein
MQGEFSGYWELPFFLSVIKSKKKTIESMVFWVFDFKVLLLAVCLKAYALFTLTA